MGHTRLAFVGDISISRQVKDRYHGLISDVEKAGLSPDTVELIPAPAWKIREGRLVGLELVGRRPEDRPAAAFCANDMLALGLLQELALHGIRVPHDLAIVGFDDLEWGECGDRAASVRQPRDLLGRTAVRMILDEIEQGSAHMHKHLIFPPELVIRDSSARH